MLPAPLFRGEAPGSRGEVRVAVPDGSPAASLDWQEVRGGVEIGFYRLEFGVASQVIGLAWHRGRGHLLCPHCRQPVEALHRRCDRRDWACRRCHGLTYRSQHPRRPSRAHPVPVPTRGTARASSAPVPEMASREARRPRLPQDSASGRGRPREKRDYRSREDRRAPLEEGMAYCCRCRAPRRYLAPRRWRLHAGEDRQQPRTAIQGECEVCGAQVFRIVPGQQAADLPEQGERVPWYPQPGESQSAYRAFLHYRDLDGRRSLSRLAGSLHGGDRARPWGRLTHWSRQWCWLARAQAWDAHRAKVQQEAEQREQQVGRRSLLERGLLRISAELLQKAKAKWSPERLAGVELEDVTVTDVTIHADGKTVSRQHRPGVHSLISLAWRMIESGPRLEHRLEQARPAYRGEEELWQAHLTLARLVFGEGERLMAGALLWVRRGGLAQVNFESQRVTTRERTAEGVRVTTRHHPGSRELFPSSVRMMHASLRLERQLRAQEMRARFPEERQPA